MESQHQFMGIHVLGEMYGISSQKLNDIELLKEALAEGIKKSGATLCGMQEKQFEPSGVTLLALLSESHASLHTYPDQGALFFDAFTCGDECQPQKIAEELLKALDCKERQLKVIKRGLDLNS